MRNILDDIKIERITKSSFLLLNLKTREFEIHTTTENAIEKNYEIFQVATLVGASSVFICELSSKQMSDMTSLQMTCVVISILSVLLMRYTANNITVVVDRTQDEPEAERGGE